MLTTAAAALGLAVARGLLWGVIALAPAELPRTAEIALDGAAVTFAAGLAVLMAASTARSRFAVRPIAAGEPLEQWPLVDREACRHAGAGSVCRAPGGPGAALMAGSALMVQTYPHRRTESWDSPPNAH